MPIITFISDLHGEQPQLPGGNLLIIAGDCTGRDTRADYEYFFKWLGTLDYQHIVFIGGNHDVQLQRNDVDDLLKDLPSHIHYLCDSEITLSCYDHLNKDEEVSVRRQDFKIYGSPWTSLFDGVNSHCKGFMIHERKLKDKFKAIPENLDILVTHSPPFGILDTIRNPWQVGKRAGSKYLLEHVKKTVPKIHVFGHIHENGGHIKEYDGTKFINASYLNEYYEPDNQIITLDYSSPQDQHVEPAI